MIAEISHFILITASVCALVLFTPILFGAARADKVLACLWKPALAVTFSGLTLSLLLLAYSFLSNDFSIAYVTNNSNSNLAPIYKITAVWAGHEGSMLLWVWSICVWAVMFGLMSEESTLFKSRVLGILLGASGLICLFLIFTSNPFERLLPLVPPEGKDLNPILQDVGMIVHPPLLFIGYAGAALCFAVGCAALWEGRLRPEIFRSLTDVTVLAWVFLTLGNILGSWWAYNELGWGGWWFWDPVENSSFIPWLLLTAELHALILARYRAKLTKTVLLLSLCVFALCLFGTFIVRSGVIQSVHAFASDPNRGLFLMVISLLMVIPALFLFAVRAPKFSNTSEISGLKEIALVLTVLLLSIAAFCILFGTLYPLIHEAMGKGSLSVGAPYFNSIFAPMVILAALLIGAVQLQKCSVLSMGLCFFVSAAAAIYFGFFTGPKSSLYTAAGVFSALWIAASFLACCLTKRPKNWFALIAHLGIAVSIAGVVGDTQYSEEAVIRMGPGQGRALGDVIFVCDAIRKVDTPSYFADEASVFLLDSDEKEFGLLHPQRQTFKSNGMERTEAGIDHGLLRDYYVSMGNRLSPEEFLVRISIRPLVSWIWLGGLLMALSSMVYVFQRRRGRSQA